MDSTTVVTMYTFNNIVRETNMPVSRWISLDNLQRNAHLTFIHWLTGFYCHSQCVTEALETATTTCDFLFN